MNKVTTKYVAYEIDIEQPNGCGLVLDSAESLATVLSNLGKIQTEMDTPFLVFKEIVAYSQQIVYSDILAAHVEPVMSEEDHITYIVDNSCYQRDLTLHDQYEGLTDEVKALIMEEVYTEIDHCSDCGHLYNAGELTENGQCDQCYDEEEREREAEEEREEAESRGECVNCCSVLYKEELNVIDGDYVCAECKSEENL